jgi:hypothetical protein
VRFEMKKPLRVTGLALLLPLLSCLLFLSTPAQAEGRCPPGFYPTGGAEAGWYGCAPMGPMEDASQGNDGNDQGSYASDLPPMRYDPQEWAAWMDIIRRGEEAAEAERLKDPLYRELKAGVWDFGKPDQDARRDVCLAIFLQLRGGVLMMDWQGDNKGTFLAFYGGAIPRYTAITTASVTLTQSGEKQNVTAFHAPFPWRTELGMVMFAVPSTAALLASIEDEQDFEVEMAGQPVISGKWHSGLTARSHLAQCVSER